VHKNDLNYAGLVRKNETEPWSPLAHTNMKGSAYTYDGGIFKMTDSRRAHILDCTKEVVQISLSKLVSKSNIKLKGRGGARRGRGGRRGGYRFRCRFF